MGRGMSIRRFSFYSDLLTDDSFFLSFFLVTILLVHCDHQCPKLINHVMGLGTGGVDGTFTEKY